MKELYELKEKLMDHLESYSKKEMTGSNLEIVDKLTHTIKNLCKIIEDAETDGGSYAMMGSYARGGQDGSYRGGRYSGYGMSYADRRGRGSDARRDSMGRYSSDGDLVHVLREMRDDVPDEKTRIEFDHFIRKMESM